MAWAAVACLRVSRRRPQIPRLLSRSVQVGVTARPGFGSVWTLGMRQTKPPDLSNSSSLETGLNAYATNPVLSPTYNPALLARAPELASDIKFLLARLPASVTTVSAPPPTSLAEPLPPFPLPPFLQDVFTTTPPVLAVYLDRLRGLSASQDSAPRLLAHAYVRYLGDLSGGQIIGARLRKAYGLDGLDGRRFYYFDLDHDLTAAETGEETVGERKKKLHAVKGWYRDGMDAGVPEDKELKGESGELRAGDVSIGRSVLPRWTGGAWKPSDRLALGASSGVARCVLSATARRRSMLSIRLSPQRPGHASSPRRSGHWPDLFHQPCYTIPSPLYQQLPRALTLSLLPSIVLSFAN